MNDSLQPVEQVAETAGEAARPRPPYRPTMLIFLIMPVLAAVVAILITGGVGDAPDNLEVAPPAVGYTPFSLIDNPAPDFALSVPEGGTIRLSAQQGRWVFVNFWATWCAPCRAEMPLLQDLADGKVSAAETLPGGVSVIAVNRDETADVIRPFMSELQLTLPIAIDVGGKVSNRYGVIQMPMTFIVDPQGIVRERIIGALTPDLLAKTLDKLAKRAG